jgi:hypothetical protein
MIQGFLSSCFAKNLRFAERKVLVSDFGRAEDFRKSLDQNTQGFVRGERFSRRRFDVCLKRFRDDRAVAGDDFKFGMRLKWFGNDRAVAGRVRYACEVVEVVCG